MFNISRTLLTIPLSIDFIHGLHLELYVLSLPFPFRLLSSIRTFVKYSLVRICNLFTSILYSVLHLSLTFVQQAILNTSFHQSFCHLFDSRGIFSYHLLSTSDWQLCLVLSSHSCLLRNNPIIFPIPFFSLNYF